jgi:hypothetical protein
VDSKKLEQKLSEVAEWVYPSVSQDNATERVIPSGGAKEYKAVYIPKPDMGPRIIKYKDTACITPCAWCGKIVNQICSYKKVQVRNQPPTWHSECHTCMRIYDPKTGELLHKNSKKGKDKVRVAWYNDPNYKG